MRILIAEDESVSRRALEAALVEWGYDVTITCDGREAWQILQFEDAPRLVILDWMMPGMDGLEVCRKLREMPRSNPVYIIILTVREKTKDIIEGLQAGADDYVTKPFDRGELRARVQVGIRIIRLQMDLANRVRELEDALSHVQQLQGLLPICSYCKRIRDDKNYWQKVEYYIAKHSDARFSHSICPECYDRYIKSELNCPVEK